MQRSLKFRAAAAAMACLATAYVHAQNLPPPIPETQSGTVTAATTAPPVSNRQSDVQAATQVAQAASAAYATDARIDTPGTRAGLAAPSAIVLFLAAAVVIVFVSTRRSRDDN